MVEVGAKYQQYAEYKDSGVEWLGEIPKDWEVNRHKYVANFVKGKNPIELFDDYAEGYFPYLSMDSLRGKSKNKFAPLVKGLFLANDNQPLIIWDGSNAGEFVLGKKGIVSSTMAAAFLNVPLHFKYYWYLCLCLEPEMRRHANGMGIPHVNGEELKNIKLALPAKSEQIQIANFLDFETAQIDTLIEKQQILIQLLKEKRQAVISHAVTKGLNPDVPMKDSGVEWLGEVPEHWVVQSVKHAFKSLNFRRIPLSSEIRGERKGSYRYYGASGIIDYINDYIFDESTVLVGEDGANLVSRNTPLAFSAHGKYWVNNHAHILKPKDELADYWAEVIEHIDVNPIVSGSAQPKLTAEALSNLMIAFPPDLNERAQINVYINKRKEKYGDLIKQATRAIQLMQERRTALISAAVTGKIDVRGWQAPE